MSKTFLRTALALIILIKVLLKGKILVLSFTKLILLSIFKNSQINKNFRKIYFPEFSNPSFLIFWSFFKVNYRRTKFKSNREKPLSLCFKFPFTYKDNLMHLDLEKIFFSFFLLFLCETRQN